MSAQIVSQSQPESFRFLYQGEPFDMPSEFVFKQHPGGKAVLLPLVGKDITEAFTEAMHSADAVDMVEELVAQSSVVMSEEKKAALLARKKHREEELDKWRWRSTAIAFSVAAVVAAFALRPRKA